MRDAGKMRMRDEGPFGDAGLLGGSLSARRSAANGISYNSETCALFFRNVIVTFFPADV